MHRTLAPGKLIIASHNAGKVREIDALLRPLGIEALSASTMGLPEPEETGFTFIANAELKARAAATASGIVSLADDSGLCVDALGGDPGIYSARWAGESKDFGMAMKRVNQLLGPDAPRTAHFICALSLAWPDGHVESFEGRVDGVLIWPTRGDKGFGYDALFVPEGYKKSFGEMEPDAKHAISHRAKAFAKLVSSVF